MLDAKKVRLSLALLPGRVVRLVGVDRGTLDSGIYRYPKENTKNKINHTRTRCNAQSHDAMTSLCKISTFNLSNKLKGVPNN